MSCDVANGSPFGADSLIDDSWHKSTNDQGGCRELDAIAEFNAEYGANDGNDTINPQLAFGNGSSQQNNQYNAHFGGLDQALSPEPSAYGAYPSEFGGQSTGSPYFQSVESTAPTFHQPPHMRNNQFHHRRSVSEPPTGPPQPQQQPAPAVMFHRDNHFLGKPLGQKPVPLKSQYKNRLQRQATYPRKQKYISEPYPRPDMRRAQTQPLRHMAPTSAPVHQLPQQYYQHPHIPAQHTMMMQEPHYVTSRVCTPTPELGMPHQKIDPALSAPPTPAVQNMATPQQMSSPNTTVSIPLSVEELRSMIFEAVQRAVAKEDGKNGAAAEDASVAVEEHPKSEDQDQLQDQQLDQEQAVEHEEVAVPSTDFGAAI